MISRDIMEARIEFIKNNNQEPNSIILGYSEYFRVSALNANTFAYGETNKIFGMHIIRSRNVSFLAVGIVEGTTE